MEPVLAAGAAVICPLQGLRAGQQRSGAWVILVRSAACLECPPRLGRRCGRPGVPATAAEVNIVAAWLRETESAIPRAQLCGAGRDRDVNAAKSSRVQGCSRRRVGGRFTVLV